MDTHVEIGLLDEYDYLIDTSGDPEAGQRLLVQAEPGAKTLLLDPPCTALGEYDSAESNFNAK